jgi:hypothetical protein
MTGRRLGAAYAAAAGVVVVVRAATRATAWDPRGALLTAVPVLILVAAAALEEKNAGDADNRRRGARLFGYAMILLITGTFVVPAGGSPLLGLWTLVAAGVVLGAAYFRVLAARRASGPLRSASLVTGPAVALLAILAFESMASRLRAERSCPAGTVVEHCGIVHATGDVTLIFFAECAVLCAFVPALALDLLVGLGMLMADVGAHGVLVVGWDWGAEGDVAAAILFYAGLGWIALPWLTAAE